MPSDKSRSSTRQKALSINLDQEIYGTFSEIGAGQEVVRHFFRCGGASGTIAKAMSAYDMDVSDIGFLSSRPFELMSQGFKEELFLSPFKFKSGRNLDSLAQITSQNIAIDVQPFWCDDLSQGRTIGITREDISIDSLLSLGYFPKNAISESYGISIKTSYNNQWGSILNLNRPCKVVFPL